MAPITLLNMNDSISLYTPVLLGCETSPTQVLPGPTVRLNMMLRGNLRENRRLGHKKINLRIIFVNELPYFGFFKYGK